MTARDPRHSEQILREIEQTRSEIGSTLNALEQRMSPTDLMFQLGEALIPARDASAAYARNLGIAMRDNPLPTALVGIGVGWLAVAGGRRETTHRPAAVRRTGPAARSPSDERHLAGSSRERLDPGRPEAAPYREDDVRTHAEHLAEVAREKSADAYRRASEMGARLSVGARRLATEGGDMMRTHPLTIAAALMGLGAIVAVAAVASSPRRRAVVADRADKIKSEIRDRGEGAAQAAGEAFGKARQTVKSATERSAEQAGTVFHRAKDAVEEQTRRRHTVEEPSADDHETYFAAGARPT